MELKDKLKEILDEHNLKVHHVAIMAQETGYLSQSLVYKFFSGEIDMTSQKFIKLLGVISKCVKTTLVIAFDNEGNCLVKKNIPLIALMESDIF